MERNNKKGTMIREAEKFSFECTGQPVRNPNGNTQQREFNYKI